MSSFLLKLCSVKQHTFRDQQHFNDMAEYSDHETDHPEEPPSPSTSDLFENAAILWETQKRKLSEEIQSDQDRKRKRVLPLNKNSSITSLFITYGG